MRITLETTREIVELSPRHAPDPERDGIPCRVWIGTTDAGVPIRALIALVAVERSEDAAAFDRELMERFPTVDGPRVFPARLVL
jgi:hypothetical protein